MITTGIFLMICFHYDLILSLISRVLWIHLEVLVVYVMGKNQSSDYLKVESLNLCIKTLEPPHILTSQTTGSYVFSFRMAKAWLLKLLTWHFTIA